MPDLKDLFDGSISAWNAVLAVLILLASWVFWRITRRNCYRLLERVGGLSEHLRLLAARIAGYAVLLLGIGVALSVLGARVQPLLAVALLVGVVLVLALKGIADNFAAGVVIQTRQPIRLGDEIVAPYVRILALEPDRITALVRFWHDWPDTRKVTSAVITSVAARLREAGRTATVTGPPPASPPQPPRTPPAPI